MDSPLWRFPMKTYDKSLIEVWQWKEKVYNETKGLSPRDYLGKVKRNADTVLSESGVKLISISVPDKRRNVA
jgi:hypothetical protein